MKKLFSLLLGVVLFGTSLTLPAFGAVKAGSACPKAGTTSLVGATKFTCVKSGKKLVWNKGVKMAKTSSEATGTESTQKSSSNNAKSTFSSPCDTDPNVDGYWKDMQAYFAKNKHCLGPVKIVERIQPTSTPKSNLSSKSNLLDIEKCKIKAPNGVNVLRAWPSDYQIQNGGWRRFPGPNTVIQVVPIFTSDSGQPTKSPQEDYGKYFEFLTNVIKYDSDNGSSFEIRVPKKYYQLSKTLAEYGITHEGGNQDQNAKRDAYTKDLISVADPEIDFSKVDFVLGVAPPGTSLDLSVSTALSDYRADGKNLVVAQATPYTLSTPMVNHSSLVSPMWWFHELFHPGAGLADHNGSNYWQNNSSGDPKEFGMGNWGLMSMSITDLLTLEKWVLGYISDQQVSCLNQDEVSQVWLSPSTFRSKNTKLAMIPLNDHQAILIESHRAGGLNYMLGKDSEGVLVYFLDTSVEDREFGLKLITKSDLKVEARPFVLFNATLKLNESATFSNIEIKVVESGEFGDVVQISKN